MKYLPLVAAQTDSPALADVRITQDKVLVLACLENMEQGTTWPQCVELMFQPCVSESAGLSGEFSACREGRSSAGYCESEVMMTANMCRKDMT
jgi:hypothetical protein